MTCFFLKKTGLIESYLDLMKCSQLDIDNMLRMHGK